MKVSNLEYFLKVAFKRSVELPLWSDRNIVLSSARGFIRKNTYDSIMSQASPSFVLRDAQKIHLSAHRQVEQTIKGVAVAQCPHDLFLISRDQLTYHNVDDETVPTLKTKFGGQSRIWKFAENVSEAQRDQVFKQWESGENVDRVVSSFLLLKEGDATWRSEKKAFLGDYIELPEPNRSIGLGVLHA